MSTGSILLQLQDIDLGLERDRSALNSMPELADLAKKRRAYQKLKADATKIYAQRKDIETYLKDLEGQEMDANDDIRIAQGNVDSSDYRSVQQLEQKLSDLAKLLDKIAYARTDYEKQLKDISAKEEYLAGYIKKFEASVIADTKAAREKAAGITEGIERAERKRAHLLDQLPQDLRERYEKASKQFKGLAVERLEGNVPSICRMALQSSSMAELERIEGIVECPYCHRILVVGEDGEES